MIASEIMSTNVIAAKANATPIEISTRLILGQYNGLPIVDDNGILIGMVTAVDILRALRDGKDLHTAQAIDLMTPNPYTVKKDSKIEEVIDLIVQMEIVLVPVVEEDGYLIGVISRLDVLKQKWDERFVRLGENY